MSYIYLCIADVYDNECRYEKLFDEYDVMKTMVFYVLLPLVLMASLYTRMAIVARKQVLDVIPWKRFPITGPLS